MKYIVYEDSAEWVRCEHEVEVSKVGGLSEIEIESLIKREFENRNDPRVDITNSTASEPTGEGVYGIETRWTFKRVKEESVLSMDDYVRRYLKQGARGYFAQHLGDAWTRADLSNRRKLEAAFPDIFTIPKELS